MYIFKDLSPLHRPRSPRKISACGIVVAASLALLPTQSLARVGEGEKLHIDRQIERQEAELQKRKSESLKALAIEQEKQRKKAETEAEQQRQANERMRLDQESTTRALTAALRSKKLAETQQRAVNRLAEEAKKAYARASAEENRANKWIRQLHQKELELKGLEAKLGFANEEIKLGNEKLDSANAKLEQAKYEHGLRELRLQIWQAVLSVSLLGLLVSNLFTYLNMRRERQRATLQDKFTTLQIEEMELKINQLRASTVGQPDASTGQPASPPAR
jgi:hypothetical protein